MKIKANLTQIAVVCEEITHKIGAKSHIIFLLDGDIGAGKTSLVSAFVRFCGVNESVTSPTFSLLHIYEEKIYHYDLYNKSLESLLDLGLLDLLENDGIHFIEWGNERLLNILKEAYDNISIIAISKIDNARIYEFKEKF